MSIIQIRQLSFTYPGSFTPVFDGLTFHMDTDWRLGLVGRNGRGKTTLLKLLSGELSGAGEIISSVSFDYFPYPVDESRPALHCMRGAVAPFDEWSEEMERLLTLGDEASIEKWGELEGLYSAHGGYEIDETLKREADRMRIDPEVLDRPLHTFSPGERTRLLLAAMFTRHNRFLLIDEPTNHLDREGREATANYLKSKQGFILVSHDRWFLDQTVDHIIALQKTGVSVESGNYSSYRENKRLKDEYELQQNEKLAGEIKRLKQTSREKREWSNKVEDTKIGTHQADRGRVGHLAAKMMKKSLAIQHRTDSMIEEKESLLKDLEYASGLTLEGEVHPAKALMRLYDVSAGYDGKAVFRHLTEDIMQGEKIALIGPNGSGKTTLIKLLLGELEPIDGRIVRASQLKISLMPQTVDSLSGTPYELADKQSLPLSRFLMLLRKLDFPREAFDRDMAEYSLGQKKKVLIAANMANPAHLYIWDEPLNYIDLESREQIENMLIDSDATMVFVEHDLRFTEAIATRTIDMRAYSAKEEP